MSKKNHALKKTTPKQSASPTQKAKGAEQKSATNKYKRVILVALALFTFVVFYPSLKCEFTNWDDGTYVTENPMIWKLDKEALKEIFTTPISLNYHPFTMLSLAIDYQLGKLNPYYYHLNNVLIHILNVLLVFIFFQKFITLYNQKADSGYFRPNPLYLSLFVAIFFAIHPMRVESVTWVAERKDVLYVFFFFLSLLYYLPTSNKVASNKALRQVACFIFFIFSCLSKGMGVVLPVIMILIDWFLGDAKTIKEIIRSIIKKTHFFLASLAFGIIAFKIQSQGAIAAMETFSLFQRLTFGCYGFIMYLYKLILPINLSAFYPYPFTDAAGNIPTIYYASPFIVLFLAVSMIIIFIKHKSFGKVLLFGFGFYFITIALVLQFLSVGSVIMADRYSYLSYIGIFFIAGYFFEYLRKIFSESVYKILFAGLLVVIGLFSYLTYERTKVWTNAETLWTDAMNQFPFIEIAYENRGIYYKDHNELDKMLKDYEFVTQKLNSKNEKIWSNLGNLHGLRQEFDESLNAYSKAIEYNPTNPSTYLNRAITYSMMGKHQLSLPDFDKAIELDPNIALTYKNRAYTLLQLGQFEKSISDYDMAIKLYRYDTLSYLNRGISKFNAQQYKGAIEDFSTFSKMSPNNSQSYFNISAAYKNLGNYSEALKYALIAQKFGQQVGADYLNELKEKTK